MTAHHEAQPKALFTLVYFISIIPSRNLNTPDTVQQPIVFHLSRPFSPIFIIAMDGLSAASSVIAVIQITQFVGVFLRDLYRDIRNARAEIERLYDSVVSLEFVAKGLDDLVERRGIAIVNSVLLEDPNGPLKQALSELPRVKEKLEVQTVDGLFEKLKLSVSQSRERSLKWPFKKEEVLHIVARLESHKSTLVLDVGVNTL
jgi:hypothetical protein